MHTCCFCVLFFFFTHYYTIIHAHTCFRYTSLTDFCNHLSSERKLAASTVLNYLGSINHLFLFLGIHAAASALQHQDLVGFIDCMARLRRSYRKIRKTDLSTTGTDTLENAIFNLQLPVGGIRTLQQACEKEFPWAHSLRVEAIDESK